MPLKRQSKDFTLFFKGKSFPPKYVISIANKYTNGFELNPATFSGGRESNDFLSNLGFEVSRKSGTNTVQPERAHSFTTEGRARQVSKHDERCQACKNTVEVFLKRIYGQVYTNYSLQFGTMPDDFVDSSLYGTLKEIYESLQKYRGHTHFVRTRNLPRVDYYVPNPGFIVEFDESQHFTACRRLALSRYPSDISLGFDREKWMRLCDEIDAHDNDPPFRDEQRAWYDTLRDLVSIESGILPTIRIRAGEEIWCNLDPNKEEDLQKVGNLLSRSVATEGMHETVTLINSEKPLVAAILLEYVSLYDESERKQLMQNVVDRLLEEVTDSCIALFPARYFQTTGDLNSYLLNTCEWMRSELMKRLATSLALCVGIDGESEYYGTPRWRDQLAVVVTCDGLCAVARKFYPAPTCRNEFIGEQDYLKKYPHLDIEQNTPRVFRWKGSSFYPAVCYDVFGIKWGKLVEMNFDAVLGLVHGFDPPGCGNSGWNYFVRLGFAGASYATKCPVFGAAVFFNRDAPCNFLTGVLSTHADGDKYWRFSQNQLPPPDKEIPITLGYQSGTQACILIHRW